jgi:hypothetical protein
VQQSPGACSSIMGLILTNEADGSLAVIVFRFNHADICSWPI